jgi:hypothetical protein
MTNQIASSMSMHKPEIQEPPYPWKRIATLAIGGLFQVGFAENSDLLLVLSYQGRGVINCITGEKIARDYQEAHDFFDPIRLISLGLGPLEGKSIRMAGLFGGGLPRTTEDGWLIEEQTRVWPTHSIFLTPPGNKVENTKQKAIVVGDDGSCEMRAYGFSETGRSFIIATSCDLMIFAR